MIQHHEKKVLHEDEYQSRSNAPTYQQQISINVMKITMWKLINIKSNNRLQLVDMHSSWERMRTPKTSSQTRQEERRGKTMWLDGYISTFTNTTNLFFFFFLRGKTMWLDGYLPTSTKAKYSFFYFFFLTSTRVQNPVQCSKIPTANLHQYDKNHNVEPHTIYSVTIGSNLWTCTFLEST
jgi:hypothetical protein